MKAFASHVCCLALFVVLVALPAVHAQSQWPTTEFVVETELPDDWISEFSVRDWYDLAKLRRFQGNLAPAATQIQQQLHEVAEKYQHRGFRAPDLDIVEHKGRRGYIVYLVGLPEKITRNGEVIKSPPAYTPSRTFVQNKYFEVKDPCRAREHKYILFNASIMAPNGTVPNSELEPIGHELFHAVQHAYPMFNDCHLADWIVEGTAQAVGIDILSETKGVLPTIASGGAVRRWGARDYTKPLRIVGKGDDAYGTSSLWRYIGEWYSISQRVGPKKAINSAPGIPMETPDYRYLHQFFEASLPGPASEDTELQWLDQQISKLLSMDLADVYAHLVPTLLGYAGSKRTHIPPGQVAKGKRQWLEQIMGKCKSVTLTPSLPQKADVALKKGGSGCVEVKASGLGPNADVEIVTSSETEDALKQLQIGVIGGAFVSVAKNIKPVTLSTGKPGHGADWKFPAGSPSSTFIIMNLNQTAEKTTPFAGHPFTFTIRNWYASFDRREKSSDTEQPASVEEMAQLASSGFDNPTTQSGRSVFVGRDKPDKDPGCEGEARAWNLCGPQLTIAMMTVPGRFGDFNVVSGTGGFIGGSAGVAEGMSSMSEEKKTEQYQQYMNSILGSRGSMITVSVPLVDYGFTGTINRAAISVMLEGGRTASTVELSPGSACKRMWIPNGELNVEEYTPMVFRGTFSGSLIVDGSPKMGKMCDVVSVEEVGSFSGGMTVPAPWETDRESLKKGANMDLMMDQTREDVAGIIMSMPEDLRPTILRGKSGERICHTLGFSQEELETMGIAAACEAVGVSAAVEEELPPCSCTCEDREEELKLSHCASQCDELWNECVTVIGGSGPTEEEIEEVRALLTKSGMLPEQVEQSVEMFKAMPPENRPIFLKQLREQGGK